VSNYMIQNRGEFASVPPPHHHHHRHLATKSWTPAPTLGPLFLLRSPSLLSRHRKRASRRWRPT
jgi:hypothetical protein